MALKKILSKALAVLMTAAIFASATPVLGYAANESGIAQTSTMRIADMKTDGLINPIGIDSEKPLFSYTLADNSVRGQKQTSYRITVAASEDNLLNGTYVWDSGEISSDETANISYEGSALAASTRYFWRAEAKDKDGKSAVSDIAYFETGLMNSGWSDAQWITKTDAKGSGYFTDTTFTIDLDFKIVAKTASFLFGAKGSGDFYMWQISAKDDKNNILFLPQPCVNGSFNGYLEWHPITSDTTWGVDDYAHMTIDVAEGTIKTYFDGKLATTTKREPFELGYIGFRKPGDEKMMFDNIVIKDSNKNIIYSEDFSGTSVDGFEKDLTITDGTLDLSGTDGLGVVLRYGDTVTESSPMFRREFSADENKTISNARLYITSAGIYRAFINGKKVTDSYLNPGMTAYDDHIMYQTYDVTNLLNDKGKNAIGVYLGHGWWNRALRNFGSRLHIYSKLLIEYSDGTSDVVVTDNAWKFYRNGPISDDDIFNGFKFDGQVEEAMSGWNEPNYDDSAWESVAASAPNKIVSNGQTPNVIAQNIPLIKNTITLDAISVTEPEDGVYVYDFGQNIAGVARITAAAPAGTTVKLRHAEILNLENMANATGIPGTIYTGNLPRADATDTYVFRGDADGETFEPFFTYHGFRYLEITGLDEPIPIENVKALLIMSDLEQTSTFTSSNELVNRLYLNSLWSARDNFLSVPTDCPQRGERFGWTGDAQIFAKTGSYMMDVNAFYQKYCMDMRDTSYNNTIIADVSPASVGNGWWGSGDRTGATNGWGDAIAIIPYQIYKQYGNARILEENYETICNWMNYLVSTSTDYVRDQSWTGDWMSIEKTPIAVTDTAFCAYTASILAEIAEVLGKTEDAAKYTDIYNKYRTAWRENFLEDDGCTTKCGTQTSYLLGIKFGLFNEDEIPGAAKNLAKDIKSRDYHLTTGFLGLSYLNPILSDTGYTDVAYKLLEQTSRPSWLYSVSHGATTIWESWNAMRFYEDGSCSANAESHNHFSYGAVSEWLFCDVLGIERDDETSNSFKHFILKPEPGGTFTYAEGSYKSIRGNIESKWVLDRETNSLVYSASVPANTTATLYLPCDENAAVYESGSPAASAEGVTFVKYENGCAVFNLDSGSYSFTTAYNAENNMITSVNLSKNIDVAATFTVEGQEYTTDTVTDISTEPITIKAVCNEDGYTFSHFEDDKNNVYPNETAFSGDNSLTAVFAYSGTDDGNSNKKTLNITGEDGIKIKVNGEEHTLPFTGEYDKGTFLKIEVTGVPFTKEFLDMSSIKGKGSTVYIAPMQDISAVVNLREERNREGYDIFFDFNNNLEDWWEENVILKHEPGYMRYTSKLLNGDTYDPRAWYRFKDNALSVTKGQYLKASDYDSLIVGFIADEVSKNSMPNLFICTEDKPSYVNPVRKRDADKAVTTDMADGKTLHEIKFSLGDWDAWTGNIKNIYLDIVGDVYADLRVDYIRLKHRNLNLTVKANPADTGTVYSYIPGSHVDLTALAVDDDFLGYSTEPGSTDYITSLELTEDTVIYANYKEKERKSLIWDFDDNTKQGWQVWNGTLTVNNGIAKVTYKTTTGDAIFLSGDINVPASDYKYLVADLRHNVPSGQTGTKSFETFFLKSDQGGWGEDNKVTTTLLPSSSDFKTYIMDLSSNKNWNGTIKQVRIDPFEQKSPSTDNPYYYEVDKIMLCEEAFITFNPNGGAGSAVSVGLPAGMDINVSDYASVPTREGYNFLGWSKNGKDIITTLNTSTDTTLYAVWEKIPEITLTASSVQISNCNEGMLIIASYNGSVLVNVKIIDLSEKTSSTFEEAGLNTNGCDQVRAFAFKNFSSMIPVCDKKSINL